MHTYVYAALMVLTAIPGVWILSDLGNHTWPPNPAVYYALGLILLTMIFYILMMREIFLDERPQPVQPAGVRWPDNPDLTIPMVPQPIAPWQPYDPNMTQPIDPEADIPTRIIGDRQDDSRMLPPEATDPDYWKRWWAEYDRRHGRAPHS